MLQFTDRGAAADIRKVLASAVANAQHNDEQDAEELFVMACFADEGPTLKRFTPTGPGQRQPHPQAHAATSPSSSPVLDDARLEVVQAREARRTDRRPSPPCRRWRQPAPGPRRAQPPARCRGRCAPAASSRPRSGAPIDDCRGATPHEDGRSEGDDESRATPTDAVPPTGHAVLRPRTPKLGSTSEADASDRHSGGVPTAHNARRAKSDAPRADEPTDDGRARKRRDAEADDADDQRADDEEDQN